jgi:hypothetical protein
MSEIKPLIVRTLQLHILPPRNMYIFKIFVIFYIRVYLSTLMHAMQPLLSGKLTVHCRFDIALSSAAGAKINPYIITFGPLLLLLSCMLCTVYVQ